MEYKQIDVITAFLNSILKEIIYVKQPTGYVKGSKTDNLVCLLLKVLYSLKQAPRAWYYIIRNYLEIKCFKYTEADYALFINREIKVIVSVYVDDFKIIRPRGSPYIHRLKKDLSQ